MSDVTYNPKAFEVAERRLKTAPAQLTAADIAQLEIRDPALAERARQARARANAQIHAKTLEPGPTAAPRLDVDAIADTLITIIAANIKPLVAQLEAQQQRVAALEARPAVKYCGVHSAGTFYPEGSLATRSGGLWHATKNTQDTPGTDGSAWVLIVKRGQA